MKYAVAYVALLGLGGGALGALAFVTDGAAAIRLAGAAGLVLGVFLGALVILVAGRRYQ